MTYTIIHADESKEQAADFYAAIEATERDRELGNVVYVYGHRVSRNIDAVNWWKVKE